MSAAREGEDGASRYTILGEIGAGGMATVHLARLHGPLGFVRTVAVKRIKRELAGDPSIAAMLMDEARLGAAIQHANVVATLDVVVREAEMFIVLEYVQGASLARLCAQAATLGEPIPIGVAAAIVVGALHGVHAAHETVDAFGKRLDLVHRDLSPQNILVGVDGVARVADFGVAKAHGRMQQTESGMLKGKAAYMAPEQAHGEATQHSDIFAMSAVAWETLAGTRLFTGATPGEVLARAMLAKVPPLGEHRADVPRALEDAIRIGLRRNPSERHASALVMAEAIAAAVPLAQPADVGAWVRRLSEATLAEHERILSAADRGAEVLETGVLLPITLETTRPRLRRRKWVAMVLGVGLALVLVPAVALFFRRELREREAPPASAPSTTTMTTTPSTLSALDPVALPSPSVGATAIAPSAAPSAASSGPVSVAAPNAPPSRKSPAKPATRGNAKKDECSPPYVVDADGRIQYKRNCLR